MNFINEKDILIFSLALGIIAFLIVNFLGDLVGLVFYTRSIFKVSKVLIIELSLFALLAVTLISFFKYFSEFKKRKKKGYEKR